MGASERLKLSFSTWVTPEWGIQQIIDGAHRHGYEGVELVLDSGHNHSLTLESDAATLRQAATELVTEGLEISAVSSNISFSNPDADKRAVSVARCKKYVEFAQTIGAPFVRVFGGELAGHYYFRDTYHADNALLAVVEILNLLRRKGCTMSEAVAPLLRYAKSPEINFVVEDKVGMIRQLAERYPDGEIDYLDGITVQYPDWWFNVRPSNTEPYLRLVLEAATDEDLAARRAELEELLGEPED